MKLVIAHSPLRPFAASPHPRVSASLRRGFSLIEVLLSIFILGIGMIMVASVFPVGARWTQETTEESMGNVVAQTAMTVIDRHYGPGGDLRLLLQPDFFIPNGLAWPANNNWGTNAVSPHSNQNSILQSPPGYVNTGITPFTLQALPGFSQIPVTERAYQFTSSKNSNYLTQPNTFPVADPTTCTYFWTALARLDPAHQVTTAAEGVNGIIPASSYKYDVYILVFRKGWANQTFSLNGNEVMYTRTAAQFSNAVQFYMPSVCYTSYNAGVYNASKSPPVFGAVPQIGEYGIGVASGTVFRQTTAGTPPAGTPRPYLAVNGRTTEPIIYCPPAVGTTSSPLVYVYQTSLTY